MAEVSLDGLLISMPHDLPLDEAQRRIEAAARDLSQGSLKNQNPTIESPAPSKVVLRGRNQRGSHFEAQIDIAEKEVRVRIQGALALSMIETTLAGGQAGVRRRVQAEVERALRERLEEPA